MTIEYLSLILVVVALLIAAASLVAVGRLRVKVHGIASTPVVSDALASTSRTAVVINPSKPDADSTRSALLLAWASAGLDEPLVLETTVEDPGYGMARQALDGGCEIVIAAGGDGTVRAVGEVLTGTRASLGILPLGTGNLLARNLGFDVEDLGACVHTALQGRTRGIDAARIELERADGTTDTNIFLVMAGIGTDAEMMADTRDDLKAMVGPLAYAEAGMRHLPGKRRPVTITLDDGEPLERNIRSVIFANAGKLQAGLDFVPDAKVDDGVLDLVVMSPRSAVGWAWIAAKTALRHRRAIPVIEYFQAKRIRIEAQEDIGSQLDGDTTGEIRAVTVTTVPLGLRVRVPAY
ncbi:diacylglycerol/lipid kinase family protein [Arthrobacter sp.]|uniref:diacylglycerol/lipid kinase family protein n=1 Tax=Arthrobacter sp. TaxID=1667 RepID=UPI003A930373